MKLWAVIRKVPARFLRHGTNRPRDDLACAPEKWPVRTVSAHLKSGPKMTHEFVGRPMARKPRTRKFQCPPDIGKAAVTRLHDRVVKRAQVASC